MKKIFHILMAAVAALSLASCQEFLSANSPSTVDADFVAIVSSGNASAAKQIDRRELIFGTLFICKGVHFKAEYLEEEYSEVPGYLEDTEKRVFLEFSIRETVRGSDEYTEWWNSIIC